MPPVIPDQGNFAYFKRKLDKLEADAKALNIQLPAVTGGVGFNLPGSDPGIAGRLWNNAGVVVVSAG